MRRTTVLVAMLTLALGLLAVAPAAMAGDNFAATLSGGQEVPARDTQARGVATFKLRADGTALFKKDATYFIAPALTTHGLSGRID